MNTPFVQTGRTPECAQGMRIRPGRRGFLFLSTILILTISACTPSLWQGEGGGVDNLPSLEGQTAYHVGLKDMDLSSSAVVATANTQGLPGPASGRPFSLGKGN